MRLAIFASGGGSNMLAIAKSINKGKLPDVSIGLVVCDKPSAPVLKHCRKMGLKTFVFEKKDYSDSKDYETRILQELEKHCIDLVVLAGFMRIIGPTLLKDWEGKMINLHPSLLPNFAGEDGIGQAFRAGVQETGVTVHFVDAGIDTGPVIAQKRVSIESGESLESLEAKIHLLEHELLPQTIGMISRKGISSVHKESVSSKIKKR